jgi:hypothetical protein
MDDAGSAGPDRRRGNPGVPLGTGRAGHLRLLLAVARWRGSLTAPDGDGIRRYVLFQHACDRRVPAGRGEGSRTVRRAGADSRRVASSVSSARCHRTSTRYVLSTTCSCSPSIVPASAAQGMDWARRNFEMSARRRGRAGGGSGRQLPLVARRAGMGVAHVHRRVRGHRPAASRGG